MSIAAVLRSDADRIRFLIRTRLLDDGLEQPATPRLIRQFLEQELQLPEGSLTLYRDAIRRMTNSVVECLRYRTPFQSKPRRLRRPKSLSAKFYRNLRELCDAMHVKVDLVLLASLPLRDKITFLQNELFMAGLHDCSPGSVRLSLLAINYERDLGVTELADANESSSRKRCSIDGGNVQEPEPLSSKVFKADDKRKVSVTSCDSDDKSMIGLNDYVMAW